MSSYLQRPLVEEELNSCVNHCSFSSMKDNKMVNYSLVAKELMDPSKGSFMRKGEALPAYKLKKKNRPEKWNLINSACYHHVIMLSSSSQANPNPNPHLTLTLFEMFFKLFLFRLDN